ncbi:MAG: hypothetical protein ACOC2M_00200 [bacterium]
MRLGRVRYGLAGKVRYGAVRSGEVRFGLAGIKLLNKQMKIHELYMDYGIYVATPGDKHFREGWVNTPCPFCTGNPGNHLGFNIESNYFYCWRCGGKGITRAISELTHTSYTETKKIIERYGGEQDIYIPSRKQKVNLKEFAFPSLTDQLTNKHIKYLKKRNFDFEYLIQEWEILGTGPLSKLDAIDYKHRIIIPIYWGNEIVSFQGRDITDRNPPKYKACPQAREIIEHQSIIYKHPDYKSNFGFCVEGVFDVWRLGRLAFATFGIDFTQSQVNKISELYEKVIIWFDPERQAQRQARKLQKELIARDVETYIHKSFNDPGDTDAEDINNVIQKFL